ncbi:PD-(D/E)XK nuclease-like domain-containing protein, partial [Mycobacterium tuberculosis]
AQADLDRALAMRDKLHEHATAAELLFNRDGTNEESAFAVVDGVPCRARFDRRVSGAIVDLKSTSTKPGRKAITSAVIDYG